MSHLVRLSDSAYAKAKTKADNASMPVATWLAQAICSTTLDVPTLEVRQVAKVIPYYVELTQGFMRYNELHGGAATRLLVEECADLIEKHQGFWVKKWGVGPRPEKEDEVRKLVMESDRRAANSGSKTPEVPSRH